MRLFRKHLDTPVTFIYSIDYPNCTKHQTGDRHYYRLCLEDDIGHYSRMLSWEELE